jgi:hypothetical protein
MNRNEVPQMISIIIGGILVGGGFGGYEITLHPVGEIGLGVLLLLLGWLPLKEKQN